MSFFISHVSFDISSADCNLMRQSLYEPGFGTFVLFLRTHISVDCFLGVHEGNEFFVTSLLVSSITYNIHTVYKLLGKKSPNENPFTETKSGNRKNEQLRFSEKNKFTEPSSIKKISNCVARSNIFVLNFSAVIYFTRMRIVCMYTVYPEFYSHHHLSYLLITNRNFWIQTWGVLLHCVCGFMSVFVLVL
jgi:hypothetical protein